MIWTGRILSALGGAYLGLMAWAGLLLRDGRLRALVPLRSPG